MEVCLKSYPTASQPFGLPRCASVDGAGLAIPNGIAAGVKKNQRECAVPIMGSTHSEGVLDRLSDGVLVVEHDANKDSMPNVSIEIALINMFLYICYLVFSSLSAKIGRASCR